MPESRPAADVAELAAPASEGAVSRAFAVLELLARELEPMRLSTVALRLGMQKSTVHRILATLIGLGHIEQDQATGYYRATLRLWELGSGIAAHHPIKRAAMAFLLQLHQATRETVSLNILSGDDVLYLDKLVSPRPIRFTSRVGSRLPAPVTAGGKAILAYEPQARTIIRRVRRRLNPSIPLCVDALVRELQDIRRKGYATSDLVPGVTSFGAPIMGRDGRAAAALTVSAPITRLNPEKRERLIEQLLVTCTEITERIGEL